MIIFAILIIILNSLLIIIHLRQRYLASTEINNLMIILYCSIGVGIYFDSYKILSAIYFSYIDFNVLLVGEISKITLLLFSLILILQVFKIYNQYLNLELKYSKFLNYFYIPTFIILTILNCFSFVSITGIEFGYNLILMNLYLFYIEPIIALPLIIYLISGVRKLNKSIEQNDLDIQFSSLGIIYVILLVERYFHTIPYYLGYFSHILINLIDQITLTCLLTWYFIILLRDPTALDTLRTIFGVKSFYIVKDNGQTIFGYQFQKNKDHDRLEQKELMLGGFIYTIANGLAHTLKTDKRVTKITVKGTNLLLGYGKRVFGVLIASELSKSIQIKFDQIMEKFEREYKTELENWTGEISKFSMIKIRNWVKEIFKIC